MNTKSTCSKCQKEVKNGVVLCYKCYNTLVNEKEFDNTLKETKETKQDSKLWYKGKYIPPDSRIYRGRKRRVIKKPIEEINEED